MNWRGLLVTIVVVEHKAKLIFSGMGSRILVTSEEMALCFINFLPTSLTISATQSAWGTRRRLYLTDCVGSVRDNETLIREVLSLY